MPALSRRENFLEADVGVAETEGVVGDVIGGTIGGMSMAGAAGAGAGAPGAGAGASVSSLPDDSSLGVDTRELSRRDEERPPPPKSEVPDIHWWVCWTVTGGSAADGGGAASYSALLLEQPIERWRVFTRERLAT